MAFGAFGRILAIVAEPCEAFPQGADPDDVRTVTAALERARVVGVLDAWASADPARRVVLRRVPIEGESAFSVELRGWSKTKRREAGLWEEFGDTPDAARKAAADAIERGEV